jgi:DNA-binding XRE family transcriptional regulator
MVRASLTPWERERGERFGTLLRRARGSRSMAEVAAGVGVSAETLREIETGRAPTPAFFTVAAPTPAFFTVAAPTPAFYTVAAPTPAFFTVAAPTPAFFTVAAPTPAFFTVAAPTPAFYTVAALAAALHVPLDEFAAACAHDPDWQEPALSA